MPVALIPTEAQTEAGCSLPETENFSAPNSAEASKSASLSTFSRVTPSPRLESDFCLSLGIKPAKPAFPECKSNSVAGNISAIAVSFFEKKTFFWRVCPFLPMCFVCCLFGFCFVS